MQEAYLAAITKPSSMVNSQINSSKRVTNQRNNNRQLLLTPNYVSSTGPKGFNIRTLSLEEMNEKGAKGICYLCNEKYVAHHKCNNLKNIESDWVSFSKAIIYTSRYRKFSQLY